jgi:hypothetical protein
VLSTTHTGLDLLNEAAVAGAFHNSSGRSDPPKCHKHTREAILDKIMDWVRKKIDTDTFIMWLYDAAGAGEVRHRTNYCRALRGT